MKKFVAVLFFVGCFFLISKHAFAAPDLDGHLAVGVKGSLTYDWVDDSDDDGTTTINGGLSLTYFFTKNLEFGVEAMSNWRTSSNSDSGYYSGDLVLNYNFVGASKVVPYIGVAGGFVVFSHSSDNDSKTDGFGSLGAQGGIKYFMSDNVFLNVEARYRRWFTSTLDYTDKDRNQVGTFFGLNVLF